MNCDTTNIAELQSLIGITEELTDKALFEMQNTKPALQFLSIYNLLLLERYENAIQLIQTVMKESLDLQYISALQFSKYYIQRKAVPLIIREIDFPQKRDIILRALKDEICDVVKEGVQCIIYHNIFTDDELLDISVELYRNKYTAIKILAVDLLVLIKKRTFLMADMLKNNNWRLRLKLASEYCNFSAYDQEKMVGELKKDHIDEVRIEISKHLKGKDHMNMLEDPCEYVRANYLFNIIDDIDDSFDFKKLIEDKSWEVKKVLLMLKGNAFKKITIPLIKNNTENVSWRIKHEILCLIERSIKNEFTAKLLVSFLIKCLTDKVHEIRCKSQEIMCKMIKEYNWIDEFQYDFECLIDHSNYLYRLTFVPIAIEYDMKFKTKIAWKLYNDKVVNVREKTREYIKNNKIIVLN